MTDRRRRSTDRPSLEVPAAAGAAPLEPLRPGGPARVAPEERGVLGEFSLAAERAAPAAPTSPEPVEWIHPEGHLVRILPGERGEGRFAVLLPAAAGGTIPGPGAFRLHFGPLALSFDERGIAFLPAGALPEEQA